MTEFERLAQTAKAASDARIADAAEARNKALDERNSNRAALERELEEKVIPTLEEASEAFGRQGITATVDRSWRFHQSDQPTVTFVCKGPPIKTRHGSSSVPTGAQLNVFQERGKIVVQLDRPRADGVRGFGGALPDALNAAIEYALTSYLERREVLEGLR